MTIAKMKPLPSKDDIVRVNRRVTARLSDREMETLTARMRPADYQALARCTDEVFARVAGILGIR